MDTPISESFKEIDMYTPLSENCEGVLNWVQDLNQQVGNGNYDKEFDDFVAQFPVEADDPVIEEPAVVEEEKKNDAPDSDSEKEFGLIAEMLSELSSMKGGGRKMKPLTAYVKGRPPGSTSIKPITAFVQG